MGQGAEERALIVVPVEGMGEAGEVGLVAARLNHFSGLWGTGLSLVVWCVGWGRYVKSHSGAAARENPQDPSVIAT